MDIERHPPITRRSYRLGALLLTFSILVLLSSCASVPQEPKLPKVNYIAFEKVEEPVGLKLTRAFTKIPIVKDTFHYGRWGGPGAEGGRPIDTVDELCFRHDICYDLAHSVNTMQEADKLFVHHLQQLNPNALSAPGKDYRERAISYFQSPLSRVLGKPLSSLFYREEHPDGLLAGEDSVNRFMDLHIPIDHLVSTQMRPSK